MWGGIRILNGAGTLLSHDATLPNTLSPTLASMHLGPERMLALSGWKTSGLWPCGDTTVLFHEEDQHPGS